MAVNGQWAVQHLSSGRAAQLTTGVTLKLHPLNSATYKESRVKFLFILADEHCNYGDPAVFSSKMEKAESEKDMDLTPREFIF